MLGAILNLLIQNTFSNRDLKTILPPLTNSDKNKLKCLIQLITFLTMRSVLGELNYRNPTSFLRNNQLHVHTQRRFTFPQK
jgi:hypothetical protein